MRWLFAAFLALAGPAAYAAPEAAVSIKDPEAFAKTLREMGYTPEGMTEAPRMPAMQIMVGDLPTRVTLGGCDKDRKNCTFLYISAIYGDVPNPPPEFVTRMNDMFDIIKVSTSADKDLFFNATHVMEGAPRSTLRLILDFWVKDAALLAEEAGKAGLVKGGGE